MVPGVERLHEQDDEFVVNPETRPSHFMQSFIPPEVVNVCDQPRKTFRNIPELAQAIADNGFIAPPVVARFHELALRSYIAEVNKIWDTDHKVEDQIPTEEQDSFGQPETVYYVLIAGERRKRAVDLLQTEGCAACNRSHGPGPCYERHFGTNFLEVRLKFDIAPIDAINIQAAENIHDAVPPHEEAEFYARNWRARREKDPTLTLAAFARQMGRSVDKIKSAIRYTNLPDGVKELVEQDKIAYGIAIQIARIQEDEQARLDRGEDLPFRENLVKMAADAYIGRLKVAGMKKKVDEHLRKNGNQQEGLPLFDPDSDAYMRKTRRKRVAAREVVQFLQAGSAYLRTINGLIHDGILGKEDSPFSVAATVRNVNLVVSSLHDSKEQIREIASAEDVEIYLDKLGEIDRAAALLRQRLEAAEDPESDSPQEIRLL